MLIDTVLFFTLFLGLCIFFAVIFGVYNDYKTVREFTFMKLDWFKVFRFLVYSIVLMAGSLYLLS